MDGMSVNVAMSRAWAMPNRDTFSIKPVGEFVAKYITGVSVDPFARNKQFATYTNDLNPDTHATYHMEALDFVEMLRGEGVLADCVLFDPPYSPRQVSECYRHVGRRTTQQDTQGASWSNWKAAIAGIVRPGGMVLSFGWNSVGMGMKHGFTLVELMLCCHGGMHNDTICLAERKVFCLRKRVLKTLQEEKA